MSGVQWCRRTAFRVGSTSGATLAQGVGYALLPVAACSLLGPSSVVAAGSPVPIVAGQNGAITLADVAGGGIAFSGEREAEARSYRFNFPLDADQGPGTWYLIRLDVSVTFRPDVRSGSVLVSGFSRGQAGAQVEFYPYRAKGGSPRVRWESVDLIRGQAAGTSSGRGARVRYVNYLPFAGVRPGPAGLAFQIERFGGAKVSEVKIGASSGIYATVASPVELKLSADTPGQEVLDVGEPTRLDVEVTNTSTRPARNVVVSVAPQASHMFIKGSDLRKIKRLQGTTTTSFTVGRTRPGTLRVGVFAGAPGGAEALTEIKAEVAEGGDGDGDGAFKPALAIAFVAAAIAAGALLRRRYKREERS